MTSKMLSQDELLEAIERASQRAAEQAVEKTLLLLGVDPEDRGGLTRLRDNLTYLDQRRKSEAEARRLIKSSAATVLTTVAISALMWAFVVFKGGLHDALGTWLSK